MSEVAFLPGVLLAVPILAAAAALVFVTTARRVGWSIATLALTVETVAAGWLAWVVYGTDTRVVHLLGGETLSRPLDSEYAIGIELVADPLSTIIAVLVAVVSLAVLAFTRRNGPRGNVFYAGYLLLTGGLMGVILTGDLFNLFVFLEIVGLTAYALVASNKTPAAALAAFKYLLLGTIGASLYLLGVGYLYLRTGTLNMVDLGATLAGEATWGEGTWLADAGSLYTEPLVLASFGFIVAGLGVKAALFPLHTWQPDAYEHAPDAVTVYLSALVSTAATYALVRIMLVVYRPAFFETVPHALDFLIGVAILSIVAGGVLAAVQSQVKRIFAYSSVMHFGLIVLAVSLAVSPAGGETATRFGIYAAVIHLVGHAVLKGGLFATAGAVAAGTGARTVSEYAGLAKRHPFLAGAVAVLGIGIVGVPPSIGFIGKWYLTISAIETGLWIAVGVVLASTLLSLLYITRLIQALYVDHPPESAPSYAEASLAADGGTGVTHNAGDPRLDDGTGREPSITAGVVGLSLGAAVCSVGLGFAGAELTAFVEPIVEAVLDGRSVFGGESQ